jgi:hypothetical protein
VPHYVTLFGQPTTEGSFHCQTNTEDDTFVKNVTRRTRSSVDGGHELTCSSLSANASTKDGYIAVIVEQVITTYYEKAH